MRAAAEFDLAAARAGYFPRLDFEQNYTGGNNPVFAFGTLLNQRRFTEADFALPSLNNPDAIGNLQTRFDAQATIWDFGRTSRRVEGARLGLEMVDRSHEDHVRHLMLATLEAYYSVSLAQEAREASRVSLESAESIVRQAEERVRSGLAVEADLLRGQVFLASARQKEIESRGQSEMARARLNQLMGDPIDAPLGETAPLVPSSLPTPDQESLRVEQRTRRPDYQRLIAEIRQAEVDAGARKSEYYPTLGGFASWEMNNPSIKTYGGNSWTAGINLRWNIFSGKADSSRLKAARERLEAKRRQLQALESGMDLEIHNATIQFRAAEQQVEAARAAEAQSVESLRILRNRYEAGLATMTDLLSAESERASARAMLAEAIYRHRVSYARIEYAAGTLSASSTALNP
jgi:outer membrane protein